MKFIDMHCDTLMMALSKGLDSMASIPDTMVDVKRMKEGGALGQFFAIFLPPKSSYSQLGLPEIEDDDMIEKAVRIFNNTMAQCSGDIAAARDLKDILENEKQGKMSGILAIEDGRSVNGSIAQLDKYYDMGIRYISLTWNYANCFGFPNSPDPVETAKGLTDFGKEGVEYMLEKGILVDVSHLSDGGFNDVAAIAKKAGKPFVATHSNLRSLSPHQRNLTDEMFKTLASLGGVSGINFCPAFLSADISSKESTVELMSLHVRKMIDLGGEDAVALGSDLDGISGNLQVGEISKMPLLFDRLKADGLSERQIEKLARGNVLRVIGEAVK